MRINIKTKVEQDYLEVKEGFNKDLFLKLNPPFPPVKLLRFDGCGRGDKVSLELNFIFFKQKWTSIITSDRTDETEFYFVDEGKQLPFFLRFWKHKHRVLRLDSGAMIIDEINFSARLKIMSPLLYPVLYAQFWYRKPIYKKMFRKG
jgi:ligand-binding SRPBCC domain-containing protein